jgi:hypothetical protein
VKKGVGRRTHPLPAKMGAFCILSEQVCQRLCALRCAFAPALYGTGDQATAVIVLKPQTPGLDTNLLVTTDRRAYYLRLISKPEDYAARIAFAYPDDDNRKWQEQLAAQKAAAKSEEERRLAAVYARDLEARMAPTGIRASKRIFL